MPRNPETNTLLEQESKTSNNYTTNTAFSSSNTYTVPGTVSYLGQPARVKEPTAKHQEIGSTLVDSRRRDIDSINTSNVSSKQKEVAVIKANEYWNNEIDNSKHDYEDSAYLDGKNVRWLKQDSSYIIGDDTPFHIYDE